MTSRLREVMEILIRNNVTPIEVIEKLEEANVQSVVDIVKGFFDMRYLNVLDISDIYKVVPIEGFAEMIKADLEATPGIEGAVDLNSMTPESFQLLYRHISDLDANSRPRKAKPVEAAYMFYWVNNYINNKRHYIENIKGNWTEAGLPSDVDLRKFKRARTLYSEFREFESNNKIQSKNIDSMFPRILVALQGRAIREELGLQRQDVADEAGIQVNMLGMYETGVRSIPEEIIGKLRTVFLHHICE